MFSLTKSRDTTAYGISEYVADTQNDMKEIQKLTTENKLICDAGSMVFVVEDASMYMLNNNKVWKKIV